MFRSGFIAMLAFAILAGCEKDETLMPTTPLPLPAPTNYYVSADGNDLNDGTSPQTPWRTIDKVNTVAVKPGQAILFKSGQRFNGNLDISGKSGNAEAPVIIGSYGGSNAIIDAGASGSGIIARNTQYVIVRDLIVIGDGYKINPANGIFFFADSSVLMRNISISNVEVSGFMGRGVFINVPWPSETANPGGQLPAPGDPHAGYDGILIENVIVHDNGMAGIETNGYWDNNTWTNNFNHKNISVRNCRAYNNHGVQSYTDNHSGSGILISSADKVLIDYCTAYNNGNENGIHYAGPIGIWLGEVRNGIIQYCESYNNKCGSGLDGGGFDVDGGSSNCIVQYCYAHDNAGAGFSVYEWGSGSAMSDITIRYVISENDGQRNNYSGIALWSVNGGDNIKVHNNTVYVRRSDPGVTAINAIRIFDQQVFSNLKVFNNIFIADGLDAGILEGTVLCGNWQNNIYWSMNGATTNGFTQGTFKDPMLANPGRGGEYHPFVTASSGRKFPAYTPLFGSPVINAGITLGITMAGMDFNGTILPNDNSFDIGAIEYYAVDH